MSIKTTLRLQADALARKIARLRWGGKCAICPKPGTEVHHLIGCSHMATRYAEENHMLLCADHHKHNNKLSAHGTPDAFDIWLQWKKPHLWWWVEYHHNDFVKVTVPWYREHIARMKATLAELERQ